jgi:serine/threonine protein phosphatase PrpC
LKSVPPDRTIARLAISTTTEAQRAASEDRLVVERGPAGLLVVVADGAGGMLGGARAAERLVEHVRANILGVATGGATAGALSETLRVADRKIATDPAAGETTAIALAVMDDRIIGASAGDSEAWHLNADECDALTASQGRRRIGSGDHLLPPWARPEPNDDDPLRRSNVIHP